VIRPAVTQTTALGAAYAAGLAVGYWRNLDELRANWRADREWKPQGRADSLANMYMEWKKAVSRTLDWVE
jgi:glycerol kinase